MAPVLSLNPKAEVTTLPPKIINPEDVVPVEDHIIKSLQQTTPHLGEGIPAYNMGTFFLKAVDFDYVLYGDNPKCWARKDCGMYPQEETCLELINTDSLEVKGWAPMQKLVPGRIYDVQLLFAMNKDAQFGTPCRFTLVIAPDGQRATVNAKTLTVHYTPPEKWVKVTLGQFTATENGEVRFSLTNFDPNWKSGIVLFGLHIVPHRILI